ncbi:hypothetical protein [Bradyrhizobium lablabi]|uniref:hypothetical protein n=1 Tax=Bradyrhizobium lablabi TaxID=722472 RepID=UPI001BA98C94|nr:hypothetical protein [Bradyrhizobium lablabi]MBR0695931.1 hypothetical protein [Bradyrhizobium lablabi]
MDNYRTTTLFLIAVVFAAAVAGAFVATLLNVDTRVVSNDVPAGTTGLARPHPPLDRAPGQPIETPRQ